MGKIYLIIKEIEINSEIFDYEIIGYTTSKKEAKRIVFDKNCKLRTMDEIYYYEEVNEIKMI